MGRWGLPLLLLSIFLFSSVSVCFLLGRSDCTLAFLLLKVPGVLTLLLDFFFLFMAIPVYVEIPGLGVECRLHLPAYVTTTATQDPSRFCDLHHGSWQCWIPTHWVRPGIEPASSWLLVSFVTTEPQWELPTVRFLTCWATMGTPESFLKKLHKTIFMTFGVSKDFLERMQKY